MLDILTSVINIHFCNKQVIYSYKIHCLKSFVTSIELRLKVKIWIEIYLDNINK